MGFFSIANQLRGMNEPVPERQILDKILAALPPNFRMVRSAWTVVPVNERTIDSLSRRLLAEERNNQRERSRSKNEEFEYNLCEVDTHQTADCRKLARKRDIVVDEPQPVVDEPQPVVDEPQPVVDEAQPVVDEVQPVAVA
jgi:hypothetical protein